MSDKRLNFAGLLKHSIPDLTRRLAMAKDPKSETALDLDMGEGGREQGFRIDGSR